MTSYYVIVLIKLEYVVVSNFGGHRMSGFKVLETLPTPVAGSKKDRSE